MGRSALRLGYSIPGKYFPIDIDCASPRSSTRSLSMTEQTQEYNALYGHGIVIRHAAVAGGAQRRIRQKWVAASASRQ